MCPKKLQFLKAIKCQSYERSWTCLSFPHLDFTDKKFADQRNFSDLLRSWTKETNSWLLVGSFTYHTRSLYLLLAREVVRSNSQKPNTDSFTILVSCAIFHLAAPSSKHCRSHHVRITMVCNLDITTERIRSVCYTTAASGLWSSSKTGFGWLCLQDYPSNYFVLILSSIWKHRGQKWGTHVYNPSKPPLYRRCSFATWSPGWSNTHVGYLTAVRTLL